MTRGPWAPGCGFPFPVPVPGPSLSQQCLRWDLSPEAAMGTGREPPMSTQDDGIYFPLQIQLI